MTMNSGDIRSMNSGVTSTSVKSLNACDSLASVLSLIVCCMFLVMMDMVLRLDDELFGLSLVAS